MSDIRIRQILAPTDLSPASVGALRYARFITDRCGAALTVMYSDPILYPVDLLGDAASVYVAAAPEHAARLTRDVQEFVEQNAPGRACGVSVAVGQPIPMILHTAEQLGADMIVMGTHARHGWRRTLLGSITDGVLHGSEIPVLAVSMQADHRRQSDERAITRILCPVNFTDVARKSVEWAAHIATMFHAELLLVHVIEPEEITDEPADEERIRAWIAPSVQDVVSYREIVLRGGAAERVLDCADDFGADFLVIGAQHRLFRDSTVVGTTTERLIRFSSSPVLVIPREPVRHHGAQSHARRRDMAGVR